MILSLSGQTACVCACDLNPKSSVYIIQWNLVVSTSSFFAHNVVITTNCVIDWGFYAPIQDISLTSGCYQLWAKWQNFGYLQFAKYKLQGGFLTFHACRDTGQFLRFFFPEGSRDFHFLNVKCFAKNIHYLFSVVW